MGGSNPPLATNNDTMEWFGNKIAVTMYDLTRSDDGEAVMKMHQYEYLIKSEQVNILQRACRCKKALIEYSSLPERFRTRFEVKYGDPDKIMTQEKIVLQADPSAQKFYHDYLLSSGDHLPEQQQEEYTLNARVLNSLREMLNTQKAMRRACNNNTPIIWSNIFAAAEQLREAYGIRSRRAKPGCATNCANTPKRATAVWYRGNSATATP